MCPKDFGNDSPWITADIPLMDGAGKDYCFFPPLFLPPNTEDAPIRARFQGNSLSVCLFFPGLHYVFVILGTPSSTSTYNRNIEQNHNGITVI